MARMILVQAVAVIALMITITSVFMVIYITRDYVLGFYANNIALICGAILSPCNSLTPILISTNIRQTIREWWHGGAVTTTSNVRTSKHINTNAKTR